MGRRTVLVAAAVAAVVAGTITPVAAEPDPGERKQQVDAAVSQLQHELSESTSEMLGAATALQSAEAQLPAAQAAAAEAAGRLAAAQVRDAEAARELAEAEQALQAATVELDATGGAITDRRGAVGSLARRAYQHGGYEELSVVFDAQSPGDLADRLEGVRTVMRSQNAVLENLAKARAQQATRRADLDVARAEYERAREEAASRLAASEAAEQEARAAEARVAVLVEQRADALEATEAARDDDAQELSAMQAESERLQEVLEERARKALAAAKAEEERRAAAERVAAEAAAAAAGQDDESDSAPAASGSAPKPAAPPPPAASDDGTFLLPVSGRMTSPYGMRKHPITGVNKLHTGQDIGAPCGTPIRSAASGTVIDARWNSGYGWRTVVDHGVIDGAHVATTYNHQQALGVSKGAKLDRGEVLGRVGTTGLSTGCHLHFEVLENGRYVDPRRYL